MCLGRLCRDVMLRWWGGVMHRMMSCIPTERMTSPNNPGAVPRDLDAPEAIQDFHKVLIMRKDEIASE